MSAAGGAKSEMGGATRVYAVCSADDVNSNNVTHHKAVVCDPSGQSMMSAPGHRSTFTSCSWLFGWRVQRASVS